MNLHSRFLSVRFFTWVVGIVILLTLPTAATADYIRVKGTVVNVRQGPGTTHQVLFQAQQGEEFELLSVEGLWCRIRLTGSKEAWVFTKLVDILPGQLPGSTPADAKPDASAGQPEEWSLMAKLAFFICILLLTTVGIWKRKQILRFTQSRLKEISGYKRDHAFRYDNRKPSDDSWEL